jgi:hypothetical protein
MCLTHNLTTDVQPLVNGFSWMMEKWKCWLKKIFNEKEVLVSVTLGGILLLPKKGVNLPDSALTMPSLTEKDRVTLNLLFTQK